MFKASVHERDDVNDIIKFTMLISYLRGNACEAIEGISLTADNYDVAIKTLEDRFSIDGLVEQNLRRVETNFYDVVRVKVKAGTKRIKLNAVVCDHVNTSIHTPGLRNVYLRLQQQGVKLADRYIESDTLSDIGLISSTAGAVIFGPIPKWACNVVSDETNMRSLIGTQTIVCSRISAPVNPLNDDAICRLWSLDTTGIGDNAQSYNDQATIKHFSETIVKVGNKYTVDLPFRNNGRPPTGYRKALGQLYSIRKTLQSKPEMFDQYQSVLDEYVKLGFIEEIEVEDNSFHPIDGINHYLPQHPVFKESATTPISIVFNASSRESQQAKSLNEFLNVGRINML
ncbi:uncharacterized protein [Palaemon carinicauda]|uniref:uncharacterized protein n=1 Tax=Palaemon carinicauda TaxID=392227 RepID=UPI0035B682F6